LQKGLCVFEDLVDLFDHIGRSGSYICALVEHLIHVVLPGSCELRPCSVLDTGIDEVEVIEDALESGLLCEECNAFIGGQNGVTGGKITGALCPLHVDFLTNEVLQELPCSILGCLIVAGGDAENAAADFGVLIAGGSCGIPCHTDFEIGALIAVGVVEGRGVHNSKGLAIIEALTHICGSIGAYIEVCNACIDPGLESFGNADCSLAVEIAGVVFGDDINAFVEVKGLEVPLVPTGNAKAEAVDCLCACFDERVLYSVC